MNNKTAFFFLNHTAHIYHAVSVAFELSRFDSQQVTVYSTTKRNMDIIENLSCVYPDHKCKIILLEPSAFYKVTRKLKKREFPGFQAIFSKNKKSLLAHDTFVSPSDDILMLKSDKDFSDKNFVYTKHGSGNFSYDFSDRNDNFDLVFLSGDGIELKYIEEKRKKNNLHARYEVVGYPKFDLCSKIQCRNNLFDNNKITVVYIPHFKDEYSSWSPWGDAIMKFFIESEEYNLILSPHVLLSRKQKEEIREKYLTNPSRNILIDIDDESESLINMTYTRNADIYLGDVSSQVYEFLTKGRPCIFLNPYKYDWKTTDNRNFDSWHLGHVIENKKDIEEMDMVLASSISSHYSYIEKQTAAIKSRFSFIGENTSRRAAKSISELP